MQKIILVIFFMGGIFLVKGQDTESTSNKRESVKNNVIRTDNAITAAIGASVANGDLADAKFGLNLQVGYKRSFGSGFSLALTYNKFNIAFGDVYNEGFMSIDLDLEYMLFPEKVFTPYLYAGPGFHAANGFENSEVKFQFGLGLEVMVSDNVGLKLYGDRNFLGTDDTLDAIEFGASNDAYYKLGFGANFYFPRNGGKKKIKDGEPTFIDENKLDDF